MDEGRLGWRVLEIVGRACLVFLPLIPFLAGLAGSSYIPLQKEREWPYSIGRA
jgi:hypothetical protein